MALCSKCGQETGTENYCGACGQKTEHASDAAPAVSDLNPPPSNVPQWAPPPTASGAGSKPTTSVPLQKIDAGKTAGKIVGCFGIAVVVGLVIAAIVFVVFIIMFMQAISTPTGSGARLLVANSFPLITSSARARAFASQPSKLSEN